MKKTKISFFLIFVFIVSTQNMEAFLDIFTTHGKRNNQIDAIIREALDTANNKWKRSLVPIPEEFESTCAYIPEHEERKTSKVVFNFSELHHAKHPKIQTLNDFLLDDQKTAEKIGSIIMKNHNRDRTVTKERSSCTTKLISHTEKAILFEFLKFNAKQNCKSISKQNLFGEREEEIVCIGPEIISEIPSEYYITWIVDLGEHEFRQYLFWTKDRQPTEAERTYLLELFQYMEAQIKNVND